MVIEGISLVLNPICLGLIAIGVIVGVIFGAIPGLSAVMAMILFLPLTFGMEPINGISTLIGLYLGGVSGGLISAILLKIPGTPSSIATVFDGGPMADNGEAGKALGICILCSFIGGMISIFALIFISPFLARLAVKFTPVEYFAVAIFSLTIIATLSGKSLLKGLLSGLLGISFSFVGMAPVDALTRFTFGYYRLVSGFDIVVLMIGLFAVRDIIKSGYERRQLHMQIAKQTFELKGFGLTLKEFKEQTINILRSSLIGIGIGILPGIGGSIAGLVAYSSAKNASKYPEKFGTGIVDGIVAPEAANNAVIGGSLIPLLTMGIPGNTSTAVFLGGLMIHGIAPGPLVFHKYGTIIYGIFSALIIANIFMIIFEYFGIKVFVKLLEVSKHILLPIIMVLCMIGAYSNRMQIFDVWGVVGFGILGILMLKLDIPSAPMIIGFVLGSMTEESLRQALMASKGSWLVFITRPISLVLIFMSIVSILLMFLNKYKKKTVRV